MANPSPLPAVAKLAASIECYGTLADAGQNRAPAEIVGRGDKIITSAYEQLSESGWRG